VSGGDHVDGRCADRVRQPDARDGPERTEQAHREAARYWHVWEARLDRLDEYLQQVMKRKKEARPHGRRHRGK
jgi:hypothetical protein